MREERAVNVDGILYCVVISDESETLLAAKAAGRVPVGLVGKSIRNEEKEGFFISSEFHFVKYMIESMDTADARFLERVVRRELGLPWNITESDRLLIREFDVCDWKSVPAELQDKESDQVFYDEEKLAAYIQGQYGYCEYGVWAVVRKEDGVIVGKAGVVDAWEEASQVFMEIGYHIFEPYRRQGYALEACCLILEYIQEEFEARVCAVTEESNVASRKLLEKLGLETVSRKGFGDTGDEVCDIWGTDKKIFYLQPESEAIS